MGRLRLAVVGTKGIGQAHIRAIRAVQDCELAAICDVDEAELKLRSQELGVPGYTSADEMFSKEKLDGVSICTPHWFHPEIAFKAFGAGVHVLCEKPLAVTVEDGEKMIDAAKKAKKVLAVCFQFRTAPLNAKAKEIIRSGRLGEVRRTLVISNWFRPRAYFKSASWRGTWKGEGGGVLLNQAQHALDLMLWISELTPERVTGETATLFHQIEVEDRACALVQYKGSATGYIFASTTEAPGGTYLEFACDKGKLCLDEAVLRVGELERSSREFMEESQEIFAEPKCNWQEYRADSFRDVKWGHEAVLADFVDAIRTGRPPLATGADGLGALELANAIVLSGMRAQPVDIPVPRKAYSEMIALLAGRKQVRRTRRRHRSRS